MKMRVLTFALDVCLTLGLAACGKKTPPAPPPPDVLVTEVRQQDVPIYNEYVGQLDASVNATIQSRVQGYLVSQNYKEGQPVKKTMSFSRSIAGRSKRRSPRRRLRFFKPTPPPNKRR